MSPTIARREAQFTITTPAAGVENDFEALAMPHRNAFFRTAYAMLRCRAEAEDAVQETYLRAWKSFHRFTPGTNMRAWMFAILFNVIRHHRRKWLFRFCLLDDDRAFERMLEYHPPVGEEIQDLEILAALRELPSQFSEVVLLADVHELHYKEIQAALHIPLGTVMSRLSRGRDKLRDRLEAMNRGRAPSCNETFMRLSAASS
jgi:RNA polymerase sigma-70 factor (ECF subfamily)